MTDIFKIIEYMFINHTSAKWNSKFDEFIDFLINSKNLNNNFMKGMNLSGRLEPTFYVEEPNYRVLRNHENGLQSIGEYFYIHFLITFNHKMLLEMFVII